MKLILPLCFVLFSTLQLTELKAQPIKYDKNILKSPEYYPCSADEFIKEKAIVNEDKSPGSTIFSTGFANSLGSWISTGLDGSLWLHDDDGPNGQFAVTSNEIIASQTVNNGFAIFDADFSNPGVGPWADRIGQLVSPVVDMTNISYSYIVFTHKYRFCCDNSFIPKVEVSTDGFLTFVTYDASIPNVEPNMISPTYQSKINISAFLDTASNLNNFQFRFNFDGSNGGSHYYWQIDDVKVMESYLYDLFNESSSFEMGQMGMPYYFIAQSQIAPMTFKTAVRNDGAIVATGTYLKVSTFPVSDSVITSSITLSPSFRDTLVTPPTVMFTDTNYYTLNYNLIQDSLDNLVIDNSTSQLVSVTKKLYSIDNNSPIGYISNISGNTGQPLRIGNVMEIMNDSWMDSMFIFVTATSTNIGHTVFGEVKKRVNGEWNTIGITNYQVINTDNNGGSVGLKFVSPVYGFAGDTLLVLACHTGNSPDVRFRITQSVPEGIVQGYLSDGTHFVQSNPHAIMVRLGMADLAETEEIMTNGSFQLYPNPVNDNLQIAAINEMDGLLYYEIIGVSGQRVISGTKELINGKFTIPVEFLEKGSYILIISGSESARMRFVKN